MSESFASRVSTAQHLLTAPCPVPACRKLSTADPSLKLALICECGARLVPKRRVTGIEFVEAVTS